MLRESENIFKILNILNVCVASKFEVLVFILYARYN